MVAVGLAVLGLSAPGSLAATPDTPYALTRVAAPDAQPSGRFGDRMASAGDLNGDGVPDFWVGDYSLSVGGLTHAGRVYAISGKDRSVLYTINSPEPQSSTAPFSGFGWSVSNLGDVNGDGVADIAVGSIRHDVYVGHDAQGNPNTGACGTPEPNGCNEGQGRAWVFSGKDGKLLYTLDNPRPQAGSGFGWARNAGDVVKADGTPGRDGISDIVVSAFQEDYPTPGCGSLTPIPAGCRKGQGQLFIFNGAPSAHAGGRSGLIRTLDIPKQDLYYDSNGVCTSPNPFPTMQRCGALGMVVQGVGDTNGDGYPDQLSTAWTTGIDSTTGHPCLGTIPEGGSTCNERQGRMYLYSGKDGSILHTFDDPVPQRGALFGLQQIDGVAPGDVNGDGHTDIFGHGFMQSGPSRNGAAPLPFEGRAWVFDGKTGKLLYELPNPKPEAGATFGYSMVSTDYNHDGTPDLYIGSFDGTWIFDGRNGALLKNLDLPASELAAQPPGNTNYGRSVAAPGDLNGDGEPDYVAGAPGFDVGANVDEGRLYAWLSHDIDLPVVTGYRMTKNRFAVGRAFTPRTATSATSAASATKKKHRKTAAKGRQKGSAFKFTLGEAATVRIVIAQRASGQRAGKRCIAPSRKRRRARRCSRLIQRGTLTRISHQGANSIAFSGRIGSRPLAPGTYEATLTATDPARNTSKPKTVFFTIIKS